MYKVSLFIVLGGGGFADFESAFTSKPEEQQAVGGGEKSFSMSVHEKERDTAIYIHVCEEEY